MEEYNKKVIISRDNEFPELKIKITHYRASFSIRIYKGRNKITDLYVSPYQRKFIGLDYFQAKDRKKELRAYELICYNIIESKEKSLLEEYEIAFKECREKYPHQIKPVELF